MPIFSENDSLATMLAGSASFFMVTMSEVFIFGIVPAFSDWPQIVVVPLIAMGLQHFWGPKLDPIISRLALRRSWVFLGLFILTWMLFFVPVCIIVYLIS